MKKQELFDKYSIDESHNVWESIDSLMSVEGYRVMHNGELPPPNDKSVKWITDFLDKQKDAAWWAKNVMSRKDWGSLYLTAKRMVYMLHEEILQQFFKTAPYRQINIKMNREYKFRGKTKNGWAYGVPAKVIYDDDGNGDTTFACIIKGIEHNPTTGFMSPPNDCFVEVSPTTIGEFSGLYDKNNKEVYEDDLLGFKVKDVNKKDKLLLCKVAFIKGSFVADISRNLDGKLFADIASYLNDYIVVGNIHDNPELLSDRS